MYILLPSALAQAMDEAQSTGDSGTGRIQMTATGKIDYTKMLRRDMEMASQLTARNACHV